jgi:hypothetical protein
MAGYCRLCCGNWREHPPASERLEDRESGWLTQLCVTLDCVRVRNITFSFPDDLIRQAKIYAAERDTSINTVVRELLEEAVSGGNRARHAADRLLALADNGPYTTADPGAIPRDELHERR